MSDMSDANPGLLWRLDIKDRDGRSIKGYPRIFASDAEYIHRLGYWMNKNYEKNLGLTFIKEGCTRTPWLNLDGPVDHWSAWPGPHRAADCLPAVEIDPESQFIQTVRGGIKHPLPDGADEAWALAAAAILTGGSSDPDETLRP